MKPYRRSATPPAARPGSTGLLRIRDRFVCPPAAGSAWPPPAARSRRRRAPRLGSACTPSATDSPARRSSAATAPLPDHPRPVRAHRDPDQTGDADAVPHPPAVGIATPVRRQRRRLPVSDARRCGRACRPSPAWRAAGGRLRYGTGVQSQSRAAPRHRDWPDAPQGWRREQLDPAWRRFWPEETNWPKETTPRGAVEIVVERGGASNPDLRYANATPSGRVLHTARVMLDSPCFRPDAPDFVTLGGSRVPLGHAEARGLFGCITRSEVLERLRLDPFDLGRLRLVGTQSGSLGERQQRHP